MNSLYPENESDIEPLAAGLPAAYLNTALNDEKSGGRSAALIITQEDILTLKRYERHALNLPATLDDLKQTFGFTSTDISGLEPKDMLITYQGIRAHALSWAPIEADIKNTAYEIDLFAGYFTKQGNTLIKAIDKMDPLKQLELTVASLTLDDILTSEPVPLSETDQQTCKTLAAFLATVAEEIDQKHRSAGALKSAIDEFTATLNAQLIPEIRHKSQLVKRSNLEEQITELENDIERLSKDINHKEKEYTTTTNNIAWGALGGVWGIVVTGGIFGSQAEGIRKAKNIIIEEKHQLIKKLGVLTPLTAILRELEVHFEDLHIRLLDAHQSATHVQNVWGILSTYITSSATNLAKIKDSQALLTFSLHFLSVVTPWEEIQGITSELIKVFDHALERYKQEQLNSTHS